MLLYCREQVIKHSLVHKVFLDFFMFAPDKQRTVSNGESSVMFSTLKKWWKIWLLSLLPPEQEMIESIRESVVYMAHTHDGARVALHCLWHGTAKVQINSPLKSLGTKQNIPHFFPGFLKWDIYFLLFYKLTSLMCKSNVINEHT